MGMDFAVAYQARWADIDFNGHMKNTAYLDYASDTRMQYFKQNGYPISDFKRIGFGPVIYRDTISYLREIFMYQDFTVRLLCRGMTADGSRFCFVNEIKLVDGTLVASVKSEGVWLDLATRKVTPPPPPLFRLMDDVLKADDYEVLADA